MPGHFIEIGGEVFQRLGILVFGVLLALRRGGILFVGVFRNAVRNEIHHVQPADFLLLQQVHRLRFLFPEDRHQHVGAGHFLVAGGLHVQHRALQHALEPQGRLGLARVIGAQHRGVVADEGLQVTFQLVQMGAARPQYLGGRRIVQQRQQQMLHGHELMAPISRLAESKIDGKFQILA